MAKGLDEGGAPDEAMLASGEAEEDALVIGELWPEARKDKHLGPRETDIKPPPNPPGLARTGAPTDSRSWSATTSGVPMRARRWPLG